MRCWCSELTSTYTPESKHFKDVLSKVLTVQVIKAEMRTLDSGDNDLLGQQAQPKDHFASLDCPSMVLLCRLLPR